MIHFDPHAHDARRSQVFLSQLVVPRPIAMISTVSEEGVLNLAPYSYYMAITGKPMLVAVSMGALRVSDSCPKHTYTNASRTGDFVINVTTTRFSRWIDEFAKEHGPDVSEADLAGLEPIDSFRVTSPGIASAAARLECRILEEHEFGDPELYFSGVHLVIAEVVYITVDDEVCTADFHVDPLALAPVARMGTPYYLRATAEGVFEAD